MVSGANKDCEASNDTFNGLGSVVNLTGQCGRVPARTGQDDWGKVTARQSLNSSGGCRTTLPEITYAGHPYDDVLAMYRAKARMHDAEKWRRANEDLLGYI